MLLLSFSGSLWDFSRFGPPVRFPVEPLGGVSFVEFDDEPLEGRPGVDLPGPKNRPKPFGIFCSVEKTIRSHSDVWNCFDAFTCVKSPEDRVIVLLASREAAISKSK